MIYKLLILSCFYFLPFQQENNTQQLSTPKPEIIYFSDLIEVDQIDAILMNNNYGEHFIDDTKLEDFKSKLGKMDLFEGSYKMGGISFKVYIEGKAYHFSGRTHGMLIETSADIVTKNRSWIESDFIYFDTNGLNLDNY